VTEQERHVDEVNLQLGAFRAPRKGGLACVHQGYAVEVQPERGGGRDVCDGEEAGDVGLGCVRGSS
jgi:hypothetical protein